MLATPDSIATDGKSSVSLSDLVSLIADVTHYPQSLLESDADFENDLGIDSVKRGEIAVVIGQRFGVTQAQLEQFADAKTIRGLQAKLAALAKPSAARARSGAEASV